MRTVETRATIFSGGRLTAQVPADIAPGEHRVVLVIDEGRIEDRGRAPLDFPVDECGPWPSGLSLTREDLYDDRGR